MTITGPRQSGKTTLCRAAFPVDPAAWEQDPYGWTADLAALRHSSSALRDGELALLRAEDAGIAYLRRAAGDAFAIVANAATDVLTWELPLPMDAATASLLTLSGAGAGEQVAGVEGRTLRVVVPGRDGVVVRLDVG